MIFYSRRAGGWPNLMITYLSLLAAVWVCAATVQAQQNVTSATLSGRVEDTNGAALTGAKLTITNLETNQNRTTMSDEEGRYRFAYLPVGSYLLTVEHAGFETMRKNLTPTVGQTIDVPVRLAVAGLTESVQITADLPVIESVRTQVAETIIPREIDELPLNGRNYLDLALLVPGVSRTNTGSNQRFAETSAVPGQGLSIAGQRNLANSFVVDGLSANDDAADLTGTYYSQDVIREFQVVTSGGIAEFGRVSGGVVNILTQSGTNDWRGRLYGFFRHRRFDARNSLAPRKDPLTHGQYGASIGGPLLRDRTFLFANFEQTRRNDSSVITIAPINVQTINNRLDQLGYNGPRIETGIVPSGFDTTNFFARVDHRLDESNQLTARYSLYDIKATNSRNVGGLNAMSRGTALDNRDQTFALNNVTTLSSRTLNEARFQSTHSRLDAPVNDTFGPAVNIAGVASFGTATFSPLARDIDLYELVDSISTERSPLSERAVCSAYDTHNQPQHHAHRPADREQLQRAGQSTDRARATGQCFPLDWLPVPARAAPDRLSQRERAAFSGLCGRGEPWPIRPRVGQHRALREFRRLLLQRDGGRV